jgi:hypothetical protein
MGFGQILFFLGPNDGLLAARSKNPGTHSSRYVFFFSSLKKKHTHFATKSSEIIISSKTAGSTLQKRSLLYKTQKN